MNYLTPKNIIIFVIVSIILGAISFFDRGLAISLLFLLFLVGITFFVLSKLGVGNKIVCVLFLIVVLMHLGVVLFIHYTQFYPFGGGEGDQAIYHQVASELSERFHQGNFSLQNLEISKYSPVGISHYWPVLIGGIYALTLPDILVGKALIVWLAALTSIFAFLLVREIGGSRGWAFVVGVLVGIYPSYLYFGSLLLKDTIVVPLSIVAVFLWLKVNKHFSLANFVAFYLVLGALTHFRFYIGYAVLFPFLILWLFLSSVSLKKRLLYAVFIIPFLGFIPQFFAIPSQGYYGVNTFLHYLKPETMNFYREVAYNPRATPTGELQPEPAPTPEPIPTPELAPTPESTPTPEPAPTSKPTPTPEPISPLEGSGSTITVGSGEGGRFAFVKNSLVMFVNTVLGPFPWQIRAPKQALALFETIPWYGIFTLAIFGLYRSRRNFRVTLPLVLFNLFLLGAITLLISNFGIITRLRIPAFIVLTCFVPFAFMGTRSVFTKKDNKKRIKICQVASVDISLKFLLFKQMKYLQGLGFMVCGVSSNGKWIKEIRNAGIPVKTIEIKRKLFSPLADFIALVRLIVFFRNEKFDIVHTHTPKASFLGQIAATIARVPIRVNTIHGFYFQNDSPWLKRKLFITIEKVKARCVHLAFTVNREDIETAVKERIAPRAKLIYLGDGIDLDLFNPENFSFELVHQKKKELGIKADKRIIGIVARLVREKGYIELFEAFKNVLKKFPDTILLAIGPVEPEKTDGISPDIAKKYGIEKNVIFLGERDDVAELYPLMDVFVLPSHREGLGLSILEASAMELPIVATDIRGCREAVDNGVTGTLVPVHNSEKLSEAIIQILENPQKAKCMGEEGRKKVEREFSEKLVFARLKKEYERLIRVKQESINRRSG